jgi:ubiquinone/menaquinone biosynthesis C-methylase UbiE
MNMTSQTSSEDIRPYVRDHYGKIAESFTPDGAASCCSPASSASGCCNSESPLIQLYETPDVNQLPADVTGLSLGCGDPITLAELLPGQTVLDLGSGGGIDCFLAGRQVGPTGRVIGVDMTPAMLEKARLNKSKLNAENVEFRLGEIEHLPVADASVDVIISNCVINLSPDKPQVMREAYRVLKPGGRLAVSDMVTDGPLPEEVKSSLSEWAGCVAGAPDRQDYIGFIQEAGFTDVELIPVYLPRETVDEALKSLDETIQQEMAVDENLYRAVFSARITARKPD